MFAGLASAGQVTDTKWDPKRISTPETLPELKALETAVKKVVDKCTPATVGVMIGAGAGSGVIVTEDGVVLTAAHVSGEPGRDCTLILPDGTRVKGKTLGTNNKLDSGMVKITEEETKKKGGKWPFIPLGKSADLRKGQWVVSLGHPGGFKTGRTPVARLGRIQTVAKDLLRSDCTLVGGDSGGPLFDLNGTVVGIHSRIGLSLAQNIHVPSDAFKAEWDQLAKGDAIGRPVRATATLGVTFDDRADDALIDEVYGESAAFKAGLKAGDVITSFDGTRVKTADNVRDLLKKKKPGDEVKVIVKRKTETVTVTVTLGRRTGP